MSEGEAAVRRWAVHKTAVLHPPIVITKEDRISIGAETRVDAFVKLEGGVLCQIGSRCHIASFCHLNVGGGAVRMEDGSTLSSSVKLVSGGHMPESETCSVTMPHELQIVVPGTIIIRRNACIFAGATVCARGGHTVVIGEGARIGAGSVVLHDVPPYEVWAGVPARFLRRLR